VPLLLANRSVALRQQKTGRLQRRHCSPQRIPLFTLPWEGVPTLHGTRSGQKPRATSVANRPPKDGDEAESQTTEKRSTGRAGGRRLYKSSLVFM